MPSVNQITVVGHLGADPELRMVRGGEMALANLRLAVTDRVKKDGEWTKQTTWFRVTVFGKQAEFLDDSAHKGSLVYACGRLELQEWESREGEPRTTLAIIADRAMCLDKRERKDHPPRDGEGWDDMKSGSLDFGS